MQEVRRRRVTIVGLRARVPVVVRLLALAVLVSGIIFVGISYNRLRKHRPFRMRSEAAKLSTHVEGIVEGFERTVTEGDRVRLRLRAARDVTYSDGHHELEGVHLEVYPAMGDRPDQISAHRSIYDQENNRVSFSGAVNIETRDQLIAKTEAVVYDLKNEKAEVAVPVTFERENVRGRADSATVDAKNKHLNLRGSVEITVEPDVQKGPGQTKPNPRSRPVTIRAPRADFDQLKLHLAFAGGATAEQEQDIMSGDLLAATLNEQKKLRHIEARGNSYLRSMSEGRAAEVRSADMTFFFDSEQRLDNVMAMRDVRARSLNADAEMQLMASQNIEVKFIAQGEKSLLKEMRAGGRPVITLAAPQSRASDPRAANKRLTADTVNLFWRVTGRDLERAEAVGNAELFVDPVQHTPTADRKTLQAPRFDCDFYESGNLARVFTATGGTKAVMDPLQQTSERDTRTLTSQKMTATFVRETQDVERLDAQGDARFNELDRHGQAANVSYTTADETVRLREGEPVVWDSRARMKAVEIDSNTRNKISYGRGRAATTYYSQEQTGGAAPFAKVKSPVFVVADNAAFQHETGVGIYTGNARMWQDDNFVRAGRITLRRETKRMDAEGRVQSALYQARRKNDGGSRTVVPVFATADRMAYSDIDRLLHYGGNVDIKQGTERITSEVADVYLLKEVNEVERTVAQRNVVLTQPGRRGTGNWAQYTAADETVVLTGGPARVEDAEQGSSEGNRLTVYLRENRVVADNAGGPQSTGRVHTKHRIKKP